MVVAVVLAGLGGCSFDLGFDGTRYRCGAGGACPPGQTCVAGVCEAGSDAASDDAAGDDAAGDDGGLPDAPSDGTITSTACGTLDLLRDDFATAGDGPFFDPFSAANVTVTESSGRLVIDLAPGNEGYGGYESFYLYDLHGGAIVAELVETAADATILEVRNHLGNKAQLTVEGATVFAGLFSVPSPGTLAQRAWQSNERFLRIREEGGDMIWELSTDGASWSLLHRRALPFDVSHVQGVVAAGGTVSTLSRSSFEAVNPGPTTIPYCPADELRDDFAVSGLYPLWYVYQNSGCTVQETGGNLVLTYQTGSSSSFCGMDSSHLHDFSRGDGVTIDASTFPSASNFVSYLEAAVPGTSGGTRIDMTLDGTTIDMRVVVNDAAVAGTALTIDRTMHRWWRMRGTGSTVIWETAPDGSTWTERFRATAPFPLAPLDVNLGAGRYGTLSSPVTITLPGVNAS